MTFSDEFQKLVADIQRSDDATAMRELAERELNDEYSAHLLSLAEAMTGNGNGTFTNLAERLTSLPVKTVRRTKRAGSSGKRINGATEGMPEVKRIEGKQQCRVVVTVDGKQVTSTPVRNSTIDKAAAVLGFQRRWLNKTEPFKTQIRKAGAGVVYTLQWLKGRNWVNHKPTKAKA